jgi:endo-1,4-beta-xylanase
MADVGRVARLLAVTAAAIVLTATGVTPASATGPFDCDYGFVSWQTGFSAELSITNHGPALNGWTSDWTFDNDERLGSIWSAVMTQEGNRVTATPLPWTARIPSGGSIAFGWTAFASATQAPDDITVNGVPCP